MRYIHDAYLVVLSEKAIVNSLNRIYGGAVTKWHRREAMTGNALETAGEAKPALPWFLTSESMRVLVPGGISCFLSRRFFQVCWEEDVAIPAAFLRLIVNGRVRSHPTKGGYPCAIIPLTIEEAEAVRTGPFMLASPDLRPCEFAAERWGHA